MQQAGPYTKQHQILAVEPTRAEAAKQQLAGCTKTFADKGTLFNGQVRTLRMFDDSPENAAVNAAIMAKDAINTPVQNTVPQNLNYMAGVVGSWLDVVMTKECTNQAAVADVVIDGVTIIEKAPATYLLFLENNLKGLRELYMALPTLAPGIDWAKDEARGKDIWKSPQATTIKTENIVEQVRLPQSSDKHPDQYVAQTRVKNVGEYKSMQYSAMITVADKAEIIARLDRFLMAVKSARMKANDVEAKLSNCSVNVFKYLHGSFHDDTIVREATQSK
jgi:hypothetical protein